MAVAEGTKATAFAFNGVLTSLVNWHRFSFGLYMCEWWRFTKVSEGILIYILAEHPARHCVVNPTFRIWLIDQIIVFRTRNVINEVCGERAFEADVGCAIIRLWRTAYAVFSTGDLSSGGTKGSINTSL